MRQVWSGFCEVTGTRHTDLTEFWVIDPVVGAGLGRTAELSQPDSVSELPAAKSAAARLGRSALRNGGWVGIQVDRVDVSAILEAIPD